MQDMPSKIEIGLWEYTGNEEENLLFFNKDTRYRALHISNVEITEDGEVKLETVEDVGRLATARVLKLPKINCIIPAVVLGLVRITSEGEIFVGFDDTKSDLFLFARKLVPENISIENPPKLCFLNTNKIVKNHPVLAEIDDPIIWCFNNDRDQYYVQAMEDENSFTAKIFRIPHENLTKLDIENKKVELLLEIYNRCKDDLHLFKKYLFITTDGIGVGFVGICSRSNT